MSGHHPFIILLARSCQPPKHVTPRSVAWICNSRCYLSAIFSNQARCRVALFSASVPSPPHRRLPSGAFGSLLGWLRWLQSVSNLKHVACWGGYYIPNSRLTCVLLFLHALVHNTMWTRPWFVPHWASVHPMNDPCIALTNRIGVTPPLTHARKHIINVAPHTFALTHLQ